MKKRIQTINKKVLVDSTDGEVLTHEILVKSTPSNKIQLKELINGVLTTISEGKYQYNKKVSGVAQMVLPDSDYDALANIIIQSPNNFTTVVESANTFYKITAGESGGTCTINITDGDYVLVCKEPSSGICTISIQAVTSGSVTTNHTASEVAYVAFYSSTSPSGSESGVTKENSTKEVFTQKAALFLNPSI